MNDIIKNLIERHTQPVGNIKPRLPGIYESDWKSSMNFEGTEENDHVFRETEDTSDSVYSRDKKNGDDQLKSEPVAQHTISNFNHSKNEEKRYDVIDRSPSIEKSKDVKENEKSHLKEKPVLNINEIRQNTAKKDSEPQIKNQNPINNRLQIKPEITVAPKFNLEKSDSSEADKNIKAIEPERQLISQENKEAANQNNQNVNQPDNLQNRYNSRMNEAAKQSQSQYIGNSSSQTIKINIGSIEVKAIMEPDKKQPSKKPAFKPKLSLDDYLNNRNGGKR